MPAAPRCLRLLTAATIALAVLWPLSAVLMCQVQFMHRGRSWNAGIGEGLFNVGYLKIEGLEKGPPWTVMAMLTPAAWGSVHARFSWWFEANRFDMPSGKTATYGVPLWIPLLAFGIPTAFAWRRYRTSRPVGAGHD